MWPPPLGGEGWPAAQGGPRRDIGLLATTEGRAWSGHLGPRSGLAGWSVSRHREPQSQDSRPSQIQILAPQVSRMSSDQAWGPKSPCRKGSDSENNRSVILEWPWSSPALQFRGGALSPPLCVLLPMGWRRGVSVLGPL